MGHLSGQQVISNISWDPNRPQLFIWEHTHTHTQALTLYGGYILPMFHPGDNAIVLRWEDVLSFGSYLIYLGLPQQLSIMC